MPDLPELKTPEASSQAEDEVELQNHKKKKANIKYKRYKYYSTSFAPLFAKGLSVNEWP